MADKSLKKILIVDDEDILRTAIQEFLQGIGWACEIASDSKEALEILPMHPFDLVISDIMMPGMDGIQFMKEAKRSFPYLDFIIMTGYTSDYTFVDIINAGAADYMNKPFEMEELRARIGRIERERELLKELKETNEELEKAIERANEMAVQAEMTNMAKSQFLANMSHEIRTPMNAVIGFTNMILETNLDEDQTDYARTVKTSADGLLSLINDILDFSMIESGDLHFEEIEFDPELLAYEVCELIYSKIGSKPIEVLCNIEDNIPSHVKGDPLRFRQVLTNLIGNASKFTESGEIELSLEVEEERDDRVMLHASIRDTGIGIPQDKLSAIFLPFQQVDGSTIRKYGGTGLGLSICKQLAALMEGDVRAEKEKDKGSTIHFTAWLGKSEGKEAGRFTPASLSDKKILIVDDNKRSLEIITRHLELMGMDVMALRNGEKVVATLQKSQEDNHPFDICVFNLHMPSLSGYDVAKQVRDPKYRFPDIPLIALSSLMDRDAKKFEEARFDGFLGKPVQKERLCRMLEKIVGQKEDERRKDKTERHKIMTQYSVPEEMKHSVRLLVAEDNPVNQKLAKMMLTKAGYQVEVANNGKEAVKKYTTSPEGFDLIFMDIQMPEMDGMGATKAIREKGIDTIPIVAMTAHAMKGDREKCLKAGMDDYITKPIKKEVVFEIIEKWVLTRRHHEL